MTSSAPIAHIDGTLHTEGHGRMVYHPTRYDDAAGPTALFFLHYYPLIITLAGLLLFTILQIRRRHVKTS